MSALALSLVVVAGALPASAATYRASLGPVAATLTYRGSDTNPHGTTITVTNARRVVYRGPVITKFCGRLCWPQATYYPSNGNPLQVVRLEPGLPDVVLGLYSGGAHCCYIDLIVEHRTPTKFATVELYLGDPGARIERLPGSPYGAFVTADDAFAYEFTDYAASGLPLEIERLSHGHVRNVTRQYPALIKKDAKVFLTAFYAQASTHYQDSVGVIAAWAADEYLLGRAAAANRFLHQQAVAGHLNGQMEPSVKGEAFIAQLHAFLKKQGY
ncbi:MAG: hypothetical protein HIU57_06995 [Acidobacteria bacterium]|nr:hypothetical protein [Acidobacteriota bacterium]